MIEDLVSQGGKEKARRVGALSNLSTWEVGTGRSEFKLTLTYVASSRPATEILSQKIKPCVSLPK